MDLRIFKKSKSADDVTNLAYEIIPVRRITSSSMAYAPAAEQVRPEVDMAPVWKSIDAPRSTFKVDNSNFFLPAGPTVDDNFWMVLANGDIGMVTKDGFLVEDSGVKYHVKRKDRRKGFTFHCGSLTIDFHPSKSLRRCFIGHGAMAEKRVIMRLKTDCQYAADEVTNCMASMLWHRVQSYGNTQWRTETDVADDLKKAAQALSELVEFAARFIEVMRRQHQGNGREDNMPMTYKKALKLLGLTKWYRLHRALNSVQCMEKAFRRSVDRSAHAATQHRSENFIQSNLLGMLGWRLAPGSMGSQRNVLRDVLTTLEVLGTTDWDCFEEKDVQARMEQTGVTVRFVKEADFTIWTQQKMMRFLQHRSLRALDPAEVRLAGQESRSEESIHPSHLRMLKALPWVKAFDASGRMPILRLVALDLD
ncbi:hypothetical protein CT0861_05209 [Colletotrichum tofieldiae]|uniref:Uncharacterized protein n=1 Tax=Colletotrichum tofieldiae TaxID=708197 RepID=A0A166WS93_9PEZI|nr:hypothetical protein CT0861_05209 [Colletotrichum tofieldiae]GKT96017.1 hypothetical protein Ct61P_13867 [Colletotrichum tofieldiae]